MIEEEVAAPGPAAPAPPAPAAPAPSAPAPSVPAPPTPPRAVPPPPARAVPPPPAARQEGAGIWKVKSVNGAQDSSDRYACESAGYPSRTQRRDGHHHEFPIRDEGGPFQAQTYTEPRASALRLGLSDCSATTNHDGFSASHEFEDTPQPSKAEASPAL